MPVFLQVLLYIGVAYVTGYVLAFAWHEDAWKRKEPVRWCLVAALLWPGIVLGWSQ